MQLYAQSMFIERIKKLKRNHAVKFKFQRIIIILTSTIGRTSRSRKIKLA